MQEINDQNVEDKTESTHAAPSKESERTSRKSNLRSRYGLNTNSSGNSAPIENIGEIKLSPGEFLKDDLTENAGSARLKAGSSENNARSKSRSQDSESHEFRKERRSAGGNEERRERRRRSGKEGRRSRNKDAPRGKEDGDKRRSGDVKREPRQRGSRGKTHGESPGNRSTRRKTHRGEKANETEPATWNAMDTETDGGLLKKAGRFLASLFGGQKDEGPAVDPEPSRKRSHRGKGRRRRRRSRHSNRGRHGGGKPRS